MFDNKKIFILGIARSGYAIAKLLNKYTNDITVNDLSSDDYEHINELKKLGIAVVTGEHPDDLFNESFDFLIKNPGIRNDHKYVELAINHNIPVINEVEASYYLLPKDINIIGITGSNGKTTTTTLIYEILKSAGKEVILCGNIGTPLAEIVLEVKPNSILVVEISDHQLANMEKFKTNISVLTNISEAHIDFWGSYNKYQNIKKRIFNNHNENDLAVINYDNKDSLNLTSDIVSNKKYFSREVMTDCYLEGGNIYYEKELIINIKDIKIRGNHNYENVMASIIVCKKYDVPNNMIVKVLKEFKGIEHRIEFVRDLKGISFYNDSKSTNNAATITALKTFTENTILIMGGLDRGQDFKELIPFMDNVSLVICYGQNKDKIKSDMNSQTILVETLEEATKKAFENAKKNTVILLSPASASWDQFIDYEERGNVYKDIVNHL